MIPYARQEVLPEDIDAVTKVLNAEFLTQGPVIPAFENAVKTYCGAKYAVAVTNATAALHIACKALGLKQGGLLWTTPITFVASANCGLYCGADVDFVDIDPITWNIDTSALAHKLERAAHEGRLPDIVVAVHFTGQSCDMEAINSLSNQYGFKIIEDASHAIGGRYKNSIIGSCTYSDVTVFSFHPVKIITTGEGGMALTNDPDIAAKLHLLRSHGVTRDPKLMRRDDGGWYYEQVGLGYNYRITDIQAALGLSQMKRLDAYVEKRQQLFTRYTASLAALPLHLPHIAPYTISAIHLYPVIIDNSRTKRTRREVYEAMQSAGIRVNVHYIPIHTQPYYMDRFGFKAGDFPYAERYYAGCLSLPMYAALTFEQQDTVCSVLQDIFAE